MCASPEFTGGLPARTLDVIVNRLLAELVHVLSRLAIR